MAWTAPTVRTTGELITASLWNTDLVNNLFLLKTSIADDGRISGEIKYHREEIATLTPSAGAVTLDVSAYNAFKITALAAALTTITVTGWTSSKAQLVTLRITQDGSGGHAVTIPAGWKPSLGVGITVPTTANKTTILTIYSDDGGSTIWYSAFVVGA